MDAFGVRLHFEAMKEQEQRWQAAIIKHNSDIEWVFSRLLHEALAARMSAQAISEASGVPIKKVRSFMRQLGFDPYSNKDVLSTQAQRVLESNAKDLGVELHEIDLASPLAYLPLGGEYKRSIMKAGDSE